MTAGFTTATRRSATGTVLEFAGELDAATSPDALAAIQALTLNRGEHLVVDLSALTFCDSSGISALLAARNLALAADAGIALVAVPGQLQRSLRLIGLADFFPAHPTLADADAAWAAARR
ncbi:STAS domain-containing protein [Amycolatopsis sp. NBC_00348]|uniref:STAS domain-containing protein n=1 Tax=unclassified Amycolatopsis TaxID=2618356 RepID=UPI002E0EBBA2|nr:MULTISPECIES: STAS domain-containing protein [unclassified Amycolatopsis]WSJ73325.1 STAS domain-containing protein [Amycolatopsis sp. NBC_01307]